MVVVEFNSPVTLSLVLLSSVLHVANSLLPTYALSLTYFGAYPWSHFHYDRWLSYWRLVGHVFGHVCEMHATFL